MLNLLVDFAHNRELVAEPGFAPKVVRWAIVTDRTGRFLDLYDLRDAEDKKSQGLLFAKCPELSQPEMKRGGAGCRPFLVDAADVLALYGEAEPDSKLLAKHAYFTNLLRQAAVDMPELLPLADLLEDEEQLAAVRAQLAAHKAKPTDRTTFAIQSADPTYPVDSEAWHGWWRTFRKTLGRGEGSGGSGLVPCFASGELVEPVATHPMIVGLIDVGGLPTGDALASFKQESFQSYGLAQAANAPVSEEMAYAYRAALNHLIRENPEKLANSRVVPWYRQDVPAEDDPRRFLFDPADTSEASAAEGRARKLVAAIRTGERPDLVSNRFYALTLSGAAGRVMVRDWIEESFEDLAIAVDRWFADLEIVHREGGRSAPSPKLLAVLGSLVRELKNIPPALETRLWRAAISPRTAIPQQAMAMALTRFRSDLLKDEVFSHARMGLLKAFHVRQGDTAMEPYLNPDHPKAAYHCGRLLAVLAAVQYRALGNVGAGVVQRFYAAASATPALVLGRLVRTAQYHLDKLDRGLARFHEARIAEVMGRIEDDIPQTLSLKEQSLFALGYYQQIAHDRKQTTENAAAPSPAVPETAPETATAAPQETDR